MMEEELGFSLQRHRQKQLRQHHQQQQRPPRLKAPNPRSGPGSRCAGTAGRS